MKRLVLAGMLLWAVTSTKATLTISNVTPSSITSTSAVLGAMVLTTNGAAMPSTMYVYFGSTYGGTSIGAWGRSHSLGVPGSTGTAVTVTVTNLTSGVWYMNTLATAGTLSAWGASLTFEVSRVGLSAKWPATALVITNAFIGSAAVLRSDDGTNFYWHAP